MLKNLWRSVAASFAAYGLVSGAVAQVAVEQVPTTVDSSNQAGWWQPVAYHNGDTYFVFNTPGTSNGNHRIEVGKRSSSGNWTFGPLREPNGSIRVHGDDLGHDQPSIAIDGDGFIHVFADMHVNPNGWIYFRSSSPGNLSDIRRRTGIPNDGDPLTYPIARTAPNGDVYVVIRNFASSKGAGELYRWNNGPNTWTFVRRFTNGFSDDATTYPDDMVIDSNGDVHLVFSYAKGGANGLRHYGSYLRYDVSDDTFRTVNGAAVSTPVSFATSNLFYQPLDSGETFSRTTGKGLQTAKLALDGNNRPSITYRFRTNANGGGRDFDVFRIRWNGGSWTSRELLYNGGDTIAALGHVHNGSRVRTYYVTNSQQLRVAQKSAGSGWQNFDLASGEPIERIGVITRPDGKDIVYASAPTEINANSGRLYHIEVGDDLTSQSNASCLSGTQSGTLAGNYVLKNRQYGTYANAPGNTANVNLTNGVSNNARWVLADSNNDGAFGITNVGRGSRLEANGSTANVSVSFGPFSDARRRWLLLDGNNDGGFAIRNVEYDPNSLAALSATGIASLQPTPYTPNEIWEICPG